jgi:tetratricopeptide (TPR) repeat protein
MIGMLALLAAMGAPAAVSPAPRPGITIAPDEKAASEHFFEAMKPRPLPDRLSALDGVLAELPRPSAFRSIVVCEHAKTLGAMDRAAFKVAAAECYKLLPKTPMALWMYAESRKYEADPRPAAQAFIGAIEVAPEAASFLQPREFQQLLDRLDAMGQTDLSGRLLDALDRAGYGAANPRWSSWAAKRSLDNAVALNDVAKAGRLLPTIINPEDALPLLVDKRYQPLSTRIASFAADGLTTQRDAFLNATRGAFEIAPTLDHRQDYATALLAAGQTDDAINLLKAGLFEKASWDRMAFDASLVGVRAANLLWSNRRVAEGVKLLREFDAELAQAGFKDGVLSIVPNLARLYIAAGRSQDALDLLAARAPSLEQFGSAESYAVIPGLKACALAGLGRAKAAEAERKKALELGPANAAARRMMIGCLGDRPAAKREVLDALADSSRRQAMLVELRRAQLPWTGETDSGWIGLVRALVDDAEIKAQLDRYSVPVPPSLVPAFLSWRKAVPEVSTGTHAND